MQLSRRTYSAFVLCVAGSKDKTSHSTASLACRGRRSTVGEVLGDIDSQEVATTTLESSGSLLAARRVANSASSSSSVASSLAALWRSHAGKYTRQLRSRGHRFCMSFVWAWIRSDRVPAVGGASVSDGLCPLPLGVTRVWRAKDDGGGAKAREAGRRRGKEGVIHASVDGRRMGTASSRRSRGRVGVEFVIAMRRRKRARCLSKRAAPPSRPWR